MSRTFASAKAAIAYAVNARARAVAPASRRESETSGPPPDPWLVTSIFACLSIAGIDPHGDDATLAGLVSWSTRADGSSEDLESGAELGAAIRRAAHAMREFKIIAEPVTVARATRRPLVFDGRVTYVRCTHEGDAEPVACEVVTPNREALLARDVTEAIARIEAGEYAETVDAQLAKRWGCSPRTIARRRRDAGHTAKRGAKFSRPPTESGTVAP